MFERHLRQESRRYQPETRKFRLNGQSTSIRLEHVFWTILDSRARDQGCSTAQFLSTLQSEVLQILGEPINFTSLLRCLCLEGEIPRQMPPLRPSLTRPALPCPA